MKKKALITGITGQDASFLAELLLEKDYAVFGLARKESWYRPNNSSHLSGKIEVFFGDISGGVDIASALQKIRPDEIYNLASQSRPGESWSRPAETLLVNALSAQHLFESVRNICPTSRVYQASSSEMFGRATESPQNVQTPFNPLNPYAVAKLYAHQIARIYRESYGLFITTGILFNHESERRPLHFVTQKVAYGAACAALGVKDSPDLNEMGRPIVKNGYLALGNLEVARDWGYAGDFVRAMWLILQQEKPDDFVIGTGQLHTIRDLCETAYRSVGKDWRDAVIVDTALIRPLETVQTLADPAKAKIQLGWSPTVGFDQMVEKMVKVQIIRLEGIINGSH